MGHFFAMLGQFIESLKTVTNLLTNSGTEWNFHYAGNTLGWRAVNAECVGISSPGQDTGYLTFDPALDPQFKSPPLMHIQASQYNVVRVQILSNAPDGEGQMFFTTDADGPGAYTRTKVVDFTVPRDGQFHFINVRMDSSPEWIGNITGIRVDPAHDGIVGSAADTIAIRSIKLAKDCAPLPASHSTVDVDLVPCPDDRLMIYSSFLPDDVQNDNYLQQLHATGGSADYKWSSVPAVPFPGFTMSSMGLLTGTTSQVGPITFRAHVSDTASAVDERDITFHVAPRTTDDFQVNVIGDAVRTVMPGQSAPFTIGSSLISGSPVAITPAISGGLPNDSTPFFSQLSITPGDTTQLTIITSNTTAAGTYLLSVVFSNGTTSHIAQMRLTVGEPDAVFQSLSLSTNAVIGGTVVTATVSLAAPIRHDVTVAVQSDIPSIVQPPTGGVTIVAGTSSTTFRIPTFTTSSNVTATITASLNGLVRQAPLSVNINTFPGFSLSGDPHIQRTAPGLTASYAIQTFITPGANPQTLTFDLVKSTLPPDSTFAFIPSQITSGGSTSLNINTSSITPIRSYSPLICVNNQTACLSVVLFVQLPTLSFVEFRPNVVNGSDPATATVGLFSPAPLGGAVITLKSLDDRLKNAPASITIPAGLTTGTFNVSTPLVDRFTTTAGVQVSYAGDSKVAGLNLQPPLSDYSLIPTPPTQTVVAGRSIAFRIDTPVKTGPSVFIGFGISAKNGFSSGFQPPVLDTNNPSTLTVSTSVDAPLGQTDFVIDTSGGINIPARTTTISVNVIKALPDVSLSRNTLSFPTTLIASSSQVQGVTISNTGTAPLSLNSLQLAGEFSKKTDCPSNLGESMSCNIAIGFSPNDVGSKGGMLTINDNTIIGQHFVSLLGTASDLTIKLDSTPPAAITAGQSAGFDLLLQAVGDFNSKVTFGCTGLPVGASCSFNPSTVEFGPSNTSGNSSVSISTTARTTASLHNSLLVAHLSIGTSFLLIIVICGRANRKSHRSVGVAVITTLALFLVSCGGHGTNTTPPPPQTSGTPAGTYTVTITAFSDAGNRTMTVPLTVK